MYSYHTKKYLSIGKHISFGYTTYNHILYTQWPILLYFEDTNFEEIKQNEIQHIYEYFKGFVFLQ